MCSESRRSLSSERLLISKGDLDLNMVRTWFPKGGDAWESKR